jgi:hypothetical protein
VLVWCDGGEIAFEGEPGPAQSIATQGLRSRPKIYGVMAHLELVL